MKHLYHMSLMRMTPGIYLRDPFGKQMTGNGAIRKEPDDRYMDFIRKTGMGKTWKRTAPECGEPRQMDSLFKAGFLPAYAGTLRFLKGIISILILLTTESIVGSNRMTVEIRKLMRMEVVYFVYKREVQKKSSSMNGDTFKESVKVCRLRKLYR